MHALSNTERRSPKHLRSIEHDSSLHSSNTDGLDIAFPLNKDHSRIQPLGCPYSMGSSGMELDSDLTPQDLHTLDLSVAGQPPLLSSTAIPCGPTEWPLRNVQQQAKRARVESIIQDMAGSFSSFSASSSSSSHEPDIDGAAEEVQESTGLRERSQGGPHELAQRGATGYRNLEDQAMGTQLQNFTVRRSRSSGGLRPRADWPRDSDKTKEEPPLEEPHSFGCDSTGRDHNDTFADPNCGDGFWVPSGRIRACGRKRVTMVSTAMTNTPQQKKKPDIVNVLMADILKYELSRAVSVSVDSIFKSLPLLEPPAVGMEMTHAPLDSHHGMPPRASPYEDNISAAPLPEVQTEALSLVVQKPPPGRSNALPSLLGPPRQHHPKPEFYAFSHRTDLPSDDQASGPCLKGGGGMDQAMAFKNTSKEDAAGAGALMLRGSRTLSTKVRYKVNSRSVRGSQVARRFAMDPVFLEGLCVPLDVDVKSDGTQGMLMTNLFSLAGGLTTSHLKKAKLMFFYTRYPSSLVLKTFFHDVQFTRCITSQLIKWFSNFREFYYIQMEKQARQAVARGVPHARALSVGRQSELFRALNMHYNKTSDFQVPERFLEVAEITLREFYAAVSLGKDSDPSWKKPIYKVICKLDSSVPEEFKSHYPD